MGFIGRYVNITMHALERKVSSSGIVTACSVYCDQNINIYFKMFWFFVDWVINGWLWCWGCVLAV
jgi:hypothetical protein